MIDAGLLIYLLATFHLARRSALNALSTKQGRIWFGHMYIHYEHYLYILLRSFYRSYDGLLQMVTWFYWTLVVGSLAARD